MKKPQGKNNKVSGEYKEGPLNPEPVIITEKKMFKERLKQNRIKSAQRGK